MSDNPKGINSEIPASFLREPGQFKPDGSKFEISPKTPNFEEQFVIAQTSLKEILDSVGASDPATTETYLKAVIGLGEIVRTRTQPISPETTQRREEIKALIDKLVK